MDYRIEVVTVPVTDVDRAAAPTAPLPGAECDLDTSHTTSHWEGFR